MKGRIAVVKEYGKPFEIDEYDVPEPQPRRVIRPDRKQHHCRKTVGSWRSSFVVVIGIAVMGHKSAAVIGVLQPPDVRFLHLEQGLDNCRPPVGVLHQGGQDGRHNLPGNAELVLQPAALHGLAAF